MKPEDKQLLLQDLCARLPYKPIVKCKIINLKEEQYVKDNHPSHIVHPMYEGNGYLYSINILSQSIGIRPILKHLEYREQVYFEKICNDGYINIEDVKPYLRPMSIMSFEEEKEYSFLLNDGGWGVSESLMTDCIDWLNVHHFDYRGLIDKGLAIEVTEENNPYKD